MNDGEIRKALETAGSDGLAGLLDALGWTCQETHGDATETWTKWKNEDVLEITVPEAGTDTRDFPENADPVWAVRRLGIIEGLSEEYLARRLLGENPGLAPVRVILEDLVRTGDRHRMAELASRNLLEIMDRRSPGDPPEIASLLWTAHTALRDATDLLERTRRGHEERLINRDEETE